MTSVYSRFYWQIGFQSRLYDLLTPEAYSESMRRLVECVPAMNDAIWLDAGCGSGALIKYLKYRVQKGAYIGTDILLAGLFKAVKKANTEKILDKVYLVQSDFSQSLPLKENSVDIIVAHFSLYTVATEKRAAVLMEFRRILREGGTFALVEPSPEYSARRIIEESIRMVSANDGKFSAWMKKWFVYPLTYRFGLKFIERQLNKGVWLASKSENLCAEFRENGFEVQHFESVYADSATLVIAG